MLSKLKNLTNFGKEEKKLIDISSIKHDLCAGLFEIMEDSYSQRKSDVDNSNFSPKDVDAIVKKYSKRNMVLAAASSVVPGPLGILGAVPELILNFGNQMNMIYDLGCAHGKENFINKDLLLDIPIAAFGGNTNLAALQNNKIDLNDTPQDILMKKATELGESIIQKTLKKSIIQFVPVAGPLLMGTWAKMTTSKIANSSSRFLDTKIDYVEHFKKEETDEIAKALQIEKIKGLTNLIECNNQINEAQIDFIGPIIENANLTKSEKEYYLKEALRTGSEFQLDFTLLKDFEEQEDLVMDLVILAKRSGQMDELEKNYIVEVSQELGVDRSFLEQLF